MACLHNIQILVASRGHIGSAYLLMGEKWSEKET